MSNYYGCTATGHNEHTCAAAYYYNKRFKKKSAWCETCAATYRHPEEG